MMSSLCWFVVAVAAGSPEAAADKPVPWYEHYERGVALVEAGRGSEAQRELAEALKLRPQEELRVPTWGINYLDYLPHLFLAIAAHMSGDLAPARQHLEATERAGIAAQSVVGARLLAAYRTLLAAPPAQAAEAPPPPPEPSRYQVFERKELILAEPEVARLRQDVLARCRLPGSLSQEKAPWYFHYELGLELSRRGDHQRALESLIESANRKPAPQALARIYGVWFLDYAPYVRIANEHARLGNRECALDAISLAERTGEAADHRRDIEEIKAFLRSSR